MFKKRVFIISLVFVLISTCALIGSTQTKEVRNEIDFPSDGDIFVKNRNGKIFVSGWEKEKIEVYAEIEVKNRSRREAEEIFEKIDITVDKTGNRVHIEAEVPRDNRSSFWDWIFGGNGAVVVNYMIKVPQKSNLDLHSTNGRIEVDNVNGRSNLATTNGSIEAEKMKGSLDAHTTNGSIRAVVGDFKRSDSIDMKTTNGSIRLTLSSEVQADVRASTVNGAISTDFPITVQGKFIGKNVNGEINGGGGRIYLKTVNGSISIYN
ncbi:DUF4097 family beta strand repeat protein [candidate division KSB1 bacterium]|nr:DUF4097 family beta strand repeat protein [candidate division KSB1 bacterium]